MSVEQSVWLLLVTAIVLANIPWILSNRVLLFVKAPNKSFVIGLVEWFLYFILTGILSFLLENKTMGNVAPQEWEFYAITFFMFVIFAFPGFIYRFNLKVHLDKNKSVKA